MKRGDPIDFITDMRGDYGWDSFTWSPILTYVEIAGSGTRKKWKAKEDFAGPEPKVEPLTPWAKYAQVLLLANEIAFVD